MRKKVVILVVLLYWSCTFSQIPRTLEKAQYIFEGEVIDTIYYNGYTGGFDLTIEYDDEGKPLNPIKPLTALKVQINHIFRGNINPGTIEMVDNIGGYWSNGIFMHMIIGHRDEPMRPGTSGMFFCIESTYKFSPMHTDNEIRVLPIEVVGFYIENFYEPGPDFKIVGRGFKAFGKIFSSKKEFYQFLSKYQNIKIPKEYEDDHKNEDSKNDPENIQNDIEKKEK